MPAHRRDSCLLLFEGEDEWKRLAGFAADDDAHVVLVDAEGKVSWRSHGGRSDTAYAAVKVRLDEP